jgi:hypothetical protein
MRSILALLVLTAIAATAPTGAAAAKSSDAEASIQASACDSPPCTREQLEQYEHRLIKRLQRANMLAAEARFRGEKQTAERLHKVFQRNFDRRRAVRAVIENPSY